MYVYDLFHCLYKVKTDELFYQINLKTVSLSLSKAVINETGFDKLNLTFLKLKIYF